MKGCSSIILVKCNNVEPEGQEGKRLADRTNSNAFNMCSPIPHRNTSPPWGLDHTRCSKETSSEIRSRRSHRTLMIHKSVQRVHSELLAMNLWWLMKHIWLDSAQSHEFVPFSHRQTALPLFQAELTGKGWLLQKLFSFIYRRITVVTCWEDSEGEMKVDSGWWLVDGG